MVKGRHLCLDTKQAIRSYTASGLSYGAIQKRLASSGLQIARSTVATYIGQPISNGPGHKKKFRGCRDPRLRPETQEGARVKRHVLRVLKASQHFTSAAQIMTEVGISDVNKFTWRRYIHSLSEVDFQIPRTVCALNPGHKQQRAEEAVRLLKEVQKGSLNLFRTAFIDEKSFRLDGPAGKRKVYLLKAKGRPEVVKRICGGGQIMLILCMTADGFTYSLLSAKETLNAESYSEYLIWALRSGADALQHVDWVWDDQARPHIAALTQQIESENNLRRAMQAAKFQDAQMAEKSFAVTTNRVYEGNKQFRTVAELREAVTTVLDRMNSSGDAKRLFLRLCTALPGRLRRIAEGRGKLLESQWGPEDNPDNVIELDSDEDSDGAEG